MTRVVRVARRYCYRVGGPVDFSSRGARNGRCPECYGTTETHVELPDDQCCSFVACPAGGHGHPCENPADCTGPHFASVPMECR